MRVCSCKQTRVNTGTENAAPSYLCALNIDFAHIRKKKKWRHELPQLACLMSDNVRVCVCVCVCMSLCYSVCISQLAFHIPRSGFIIIVIYLTLTFSTVQYMRHVCVCTSVCVRVSVCVCVCLNGLHFDIRMLFWLLSSTLLECVTSILIKHSYLRTVLLTVAAGPGIFE